MSKSYYSKSGFNNPVITQVEGENPWITYDKYRIFNKNGCINRVFLGDPGTGKSYALLSYVLMLNSNFDMEKDWYFRAAPMFREMQKDHPKGKIWVLDESGIDLNNLNYHDEVNKGLNTFLQTGRSRNYFLGLTLPYMSLLSKPVRKLMTSQFVLEGWSAHSNKATLSPQQLQWNDGMNKFYYKRLLLKQEGKRNAFINKTKIAKPPQELINRYEALKKKFVSNLFEEVATKLDNYDQKKKQLLNPVNQPLTLIQEETLRLFEAGKTIPEIAEITQRSKKAVYDCKLAIQRRNIDIQGQKDGQGHITKYVVTHLEN